MRCTVETGIRASFGAKDRRCKHARTRARIALIMVLGVPGLASGIVGCTVPRWPVAGTVTSPFGLRFRGMSPDLHPGVDIAAPSGTPVHAMRAGRVEFAGTMSGYGLTIIVDHGRGLHTLYGHLSRIDVARGDIVPRDQVVGLVGATGNATAPHLHFEVRRRGRQEDPVHLLGSWPRR